MAAWVTTKVPRVHRFAPQLAPVPTFLQVPSHFLHADGWPSYKTPFQELPLEKKMLLTIYIALLFLAHSGIAQQQDSLPVRLPQVDIEGRNNGTCPSAEVTEQARNSTKEEIRSILRDTVVPLLDRTSIYGRCPCGGPGQWHRIAHLDMSDPNQQCPSNWRLVTTPVRGCGRLNNNNNCNSAVFPSNGSSYSRVCGRINAIQKGAPDAFNPSIQGRNPGLEGVYIDGVSLTHGAAGSRQHIWTFAAALYENNPSYTPAWVCQCSNTNINWPHQIPSFIGENYFCDTGSRDSHTYPTVYQDDPLWDGEGCGPTSTCCQLNNPPWFCTTLPQPSTDDIELRICADQPLSNEDIYVQHVDIYVM